MRTAYLRTSLNRAKTNRHILISIGFGLTLILNATSAETTGISAMGLALAKPFVSLARRTMSPRDILSAGDARHYRLAFSAVSAGHWDDADIEADRASDTSLKGEVLAARYLSPGYRADYAELSAWLTRYSDLPDAPGIRHMASGLHSTGTSLPATLSSSTGTFEPEQSGVRLPGVGMLSRIRLTGRYEDSDLRAVNKLVVTLSSHLRDDAAITALRILDISPAVSLLEKQDLASIQAHVAASLLYDGETGAALRLARDSLLNEESDEARWTAGLADYRLERYSDARDNFAAIGKPGFAEPWTSSAAAFWAARASQKLRDSAQADRYLAEAASYRGTFYGMLAERTLGEAILSSSCQRPSSADAAAIASSPSGRRALALMQIGQTARAEANLRQLDVSGKSALHDALRLYAWQMDLPNLAQSVEVGLVGDNAAQPGRLAYPVPRWQPKNGFTTDPALVYAIMRQESRFDARAESDAGAIGLMQIMPQTGISVSPGQQGTDSLLQMKRKLRDPQVNIELGQRYVRTLLSSSHVSGNLLLMAAAYNGGPGNLTRWRGDGAEIDPLMFIETLPAAETRGFVEQVMTNYWVYQLEMNVKPASLSDLAAGQWPIYQPTVQQPVLVADRN